METPLFDQWRSRSPHYDESHEAVCDSVRAFVSREITPLPAKIYANEGACQFLFLQGHEPCEVSYGDRAGKYMGQRGVTLPRL